MSRWSAFQLHRSRVGPLAQLCCPQRYVCLIPQELIRFLDKGGSGAYGRRGLSGMTEAYVPSAAVGLSVSLCSSLVQRQSRGNSYDLHYFQQGGLSRSGTLVIQLQVRFLRDAGARKEA